MTLKLEKFSYLSSWFFRLSSLIGLRYLLLALSLRTGVVGKGYLEEGYLVLERGSRVKAIQSVSCPVSLGMDNDMIPHQPTPTQKSS